MSSKGFHWHQDLFSAVCIFLCDDGHHTDLHYLSVTVYGGLLPMGSCCSVWQLCTELSMLVLGHYTLYEIKLSKKLTYCLVLCFPFLRKQEWVNLRCFIAQPVFPSKVCRPVAGFRTTWCFFEFFLCSLSFLFVFVRIFHSFWHQTLSL